MGVASSENQNATTTGQLFLNLTYQSLAIFFGSFLVGSLPIWVPLSQKFLNYLTLFGAVLLSSFILVVIIPEGFEILVEAYPEEIEGEESGGIEWAALGGICLIVGFFLIFMIDVYFGLHGDHPDEEAEPTQTGNSNKQKKSKSSNLLSVGFIFHAMCDGVALGAAVYSDSSDLALAIFIGVFAHKLVVGLALTINLLGKCSKKMMLIYLFIFSIAAPIGGYIVLGILVGVDAPSESVAPGVLILISAGTLIYVGIAHSLPEAIQQRKGGHNHNHSHGHSSKSNNTTDHDLGHGHAHNNSQSHGTTSTNSNSGNDNAAATLDTHEMKGTGTTIDRNTHISVAHEHLESHKIDWIDFVLIVVAVGIPIILATCVEE